VGSTRTRWRTRWTPTRSRAAGEGRGGHPLDRVPPEWVSCEWFQRLLTNLRPRRDFDHLRARSSGAENAEPAEIERVRSPPPLNYVPRLRTMSAFHATVQPMRWKIAIFALSVVALQQPSWACCSGDCNRDGRVDVAELMLGVDIVLAQSAPDTCPAYDRPAGGLPSVDALVRAINAALLGCSATSVQRRFATFDASVSYASEHYEVVGSASLNTDDSLSVRFNLWTLNELSVRGLRESGGNFALDGLFQCGCDYFCRVTGTADHLIDSMHETIRGALENEHFSHHPAITFELSHHCDDLPSRFSGHHALQLSNGIAQPAAPAILHSEFRIASSGIGELFAVEQSQQGDVVGTLEATCRISPSGLMHCHGPYLSHASLFAKYVTVVGSLSSLRGEFVAQYYCADYICGCAEHGAWSAD